MSQWNQHRPHLVIQSIDQINLQLMNWRKELPSRHHYILNPQHEFGLLLREFVRFQYAVIADSRSREKGARWYEPVGTIHEKYKVNRLAVVKLRDIKVKDARERGTNISLRRGVRPITIYRRKDGGPDLPAMRALLENPLTVGR